MDNRIFSKFHHGRQIIAGDRNYVDAIWWYLLLRGLLAGTLGVCALLWPTISLGILLRLVGLYLIADGVAGLLTAWRIGDRGASVLPMIVALLVGTVLLFWPAVSVRALLMLLGVWALLSGASHWSRARLYPVRTTERTLLSRIGLIATVLGVVLIFWPGTGVVAISWLIAAAALIVATLYIFTALRLRRATQVLG